MRSIAILVAICALAEPAAAETWKEYGYPDFAFSVTFPADPKTDSTNYQPVDGRSVPAQCGRSRKTSHSSKSPSPILRIPASTRTQSSTTQ